MGKDLREDVWSGFANGDYGIVYLEINKDFWNGEWVVNVWENGDIRDDIENFGDFKGHYKNFWLSINDVNVVPPMSAEMIWPEAI